MLGKNVGKLLILGITRTLTLNGDDEGFGGILLEEFIHFAHQVAEVLVTGEGDREDTVDKDELILFRAIWILWLHTNVEESHAVLQLFARADSLTAHGGWGDMACRGVVRSWDGQSGEEGVIAELAHPCVQIG